MNSQNQSIPSMAHTQEYHVVCQQSLYNSMVMMCQKEGNNLFFLFFFSLFWDRFPFTYGC